MTRNEIYGHLNRARRPIDFFGEVFAEQDLDTHYETIKQILMKDAVTPKDRYIANEGMILLEALYEEGKKELAGGIYSISEMADIYDKCKPLFDIDIDGKKHVFYEQIYHGELADIYRGTCNGSLVCMKLASDKKDNSLLSDEYKILKKYNHSSYPIVRHKIKVNDKVAIIEDAFDGENLSDIMERNPYGLDPEVVMWIMERLFSAIGYLHVNHIVHGNLIPENLVINKANHNVIMTGFGFSIAEAHKEGAKYRIRNKTFSAPEVSATEIVSPKSDIYSLGKLAIHMLGEDARYNHLPLLLHPQISNFIKRMIEKDKDKRPDDAWALWDEWRELRTAIYGASRFRQIEF